MLGCWINGEAAQSVTVSDRGLQYGDGLFETIAVTPRGPRLLARHLARLARGAAVLGIPLPDEAILRLDIERAAAVSGAGIVKLLLTRGSGGRGYRPPPHAAPNRVVTSFAPPDYPAAYANDGVAVRTCQTRLAEQPALAGLKTLNRLEQVLARAEWQGADPWEGLMLDTSGRVVCGTMTNVFCVRDGAWRTPTMARCGVAGVVRAALIDELVAAGAPCIVADLTPADLRDADEILLTNALAGVVPVRRLDGVDFKPGAAVRWAQGILARQS